MEIREISENVYTKYALKNKYLSSYQLSGWGNLKATTGWVKHLIGFYDDGSLKGVTLLLEKNLFLKKKIFYAPRGYLTDFEDKDLLKSITISLKSYLKQKKAIMLKIDPNVIYTFRDSEGNIIDNVNDDLINYLKEIDYKHYGFNKEFETLQPRFLCRYKIEDSYENTIKKFTKSTQKNTEKAYSMGVCIQKAEETDVKIFCDQLNKTAQKNNIVTRPISYYEKMFKEIRDYSEIFLCYIDTNKYKNNLNDMLEEEEKQLDNIKQQMEKCNVGEKLKKNFEIHNRKIDEIKKKLIKADSLIKQGDKIYIGALHSLFIGNEGITFNSGTDANYKDFYPKYVLYDAHLKESIKRNKEYVNFYGISGNFDKKSKNYGIFEVKKGYNPTVVELIGEFDLIISPLYYRLYKIAFFLYHNLKKIIKK